METAFNIVVGLLMLSSAFVVLGLLGKLLLRGVPLEELRTDKLWRSDRAAWAVRLLRPALFALAAATVGLGAVLVIDAL